MPYFPSYNKTTMRFRPYIPQVIPAMLRPKPQRARATQTRQAYNNSLVMTTTKRKRKYGKVSFKDQLFDTFAAKHSTGEQGLSMTHNTLYTLIPTAINTQGDGNTNRDGDSIVLCALKLTGFWNTDTASNGYSYRLIVGYTGEEHSNTTFASTLGLSEIALPNTAGNTTTNMQINAKAFTVLHDEKFTLNSQLSGVRDKLDFSVTVPLNNKLFYYQSSGSNLGKDKNLAVVICSDVISGVSGTTPTGGTTISWDFVFKNNG